MEAKPSQSSTIRPRRPRKWPSDWNAPNARGEDSSVSQEQRLWSSVVN